MVRFFGRDGDKTEITIGNVPHEPLSPEWFDCIDDSLLALQEFECAYWRRRWWVSRKRRALQVGDISERVGLARARFDALRREWLGYGRPHE